MSIARSKISIRHNERGKGANKSMLGPALKLYKPLISRRDVREFPQIVSVSPGIGFRRTSVPAKIPLPRGCSSWAWSGASLSHSTSHMFSSKPWAKPRRAGITLSIELTPFCSTSRYSSGLRSRALRVTCLWHRESGLRFWDSLWGFVAHWLVRH